MIFSRAGYFSVFCLPDNRMYHCRRRDCGKTVDGLDQAQALVPGDGLQRLGGAALDVDRIGHGWSIRSRLALSQSSTGSAGSLSTSMARERSSKSSR